MSSKIKSTLEYVGMTSLLLAGAAVGAVSSLFLIHVMNISTFSSEATEWMVAGLSVLAVAGVCMGVASAGLLIVGVAGGIRDLLSLGFSGLKAEDRMYARWKAEDYAARGPQQKALLNRARREFGPETALWP